MEAQLFCLKWNRQQVNMLTMFEQLLSTETFVDVTLACDGLSLKAHKVVLSACSPYFQRLLVNNPCKHPIVIMHGIKYSNLKAILDFMYKGEVYICYDQLDALLKTAETLQVKGLAEISGENRVASPGITEHSASFSPPPPPPTNLSIPQTRSDSLASLREKSHGRPRKRFWSGSTDSEEEVPTKIKEPEIEELPQERSASHIEKVNMLHNELSAFLKTTGTLEVEGLADMNGENKVASSGVIEQSASSSPPLPPTNLLIPQTRSDFPASLKQERHGRPRRMFSSDPNDNKEIPTKIKELESPEIEELSEELSMSQIEKVTVLFHQLNALVKTTEARKVKGLAEMSGENRVASPGISEQSSGSSPPPTNLPIHQIRSDSPASIRKRHGRPRKMSWSGSSDSTEEVPTKIKEPEYPEIEKLPQERSASHIEKMNMFHNELSAFLTTTKAFKVKELAEMNEENRVASSGIIERSADSSPPPPTNLLIPQTRSDLPASLRQKRHALPGRMFWSDSNNSTEVPTKIKEPESPEIEQSMSDTEKVIMLLHQLSASQKTTEAHKVKGLAEMSGENWVASPGITEESSGSSPPPTNLPIRQIRSDSPASIRKRHRRPRKMFWSGSKEVPTKIKEPEYLEIEELPQKRSVSHIEKVNVFRDEFSALLNTTETLKVKGLDEMSGENKMASCGITEQSTGSSPPPSINLFIPQTRSDFPASLKQERHGRPRRMFWSDANENEEVPTIIKEPESPEIEELSQEQSASHTKLSGLLKTAEAFKVKGLAEMSGGNRVASSGITERSSSSSPPPTNLPIPQTRSDSPGSLREKWHGRLRKRLQNSSTDSKEEVPIKMKEPESPEIEELFQEPYQNSVHSSGAVENNSHLSRKPQSSRSSQEIVSEEPSDSVFSIEPPVLLEPTSEQPQPTNQEVHIQETNSETETITIQKFKCKICGALIGLVEDLALHLRTHGVFL